MRPLVLAALIVALGLLGCGGGGDDSSESGGELAVRASIEGFSFSDDPATCRQIYTPGFLERMAGGVEGEAALLVCEQVVARGNQLHSRDVDLSEINLTGGKATADVAFTGGTFDGQTITFALVREQGRWRIDRMVGFVEFDRDRLLEGIKRQIGQAGTARDGQLQACMLERFEELDDQELQDLALYADPRGLYGIAEECGRGQEGIQET